MLLRLFDFRVLGLQCIFVLFVAYNSASGEPNSTDALLSPPVSINGTVPTLFGITPDRVKTFWHLDLSFGGKYRDWHPDPKMFYKKQKVVELCDAITARDVRRMAELIDSGVDVNATGKHNMTPLYWAYFVDDDPRPFGLLLKHGANPNVACGFVLDGWPSKITHGGNSVSNLVSFGVYNRHYKNVFEHGGDPNIPSKSLITPGVTPLLALHGETPDALERLLLLIEKGADLDARYASGQTFVGQKLKSRYTHSYSLALAALKAGADFDVYHKEKAGGYFRFVHYLAASETHLSGCSKAEQRCYHELVAWLERRGESISEARNDLKRWEEWNKYKRPEWFEKEHQERLARDAKVPEKESAVQKP